MSHKTPIIFSIILLTIIIFCLIMFLVTYLCGGKISLIHIGERNSKVIYDKDFPLEDVKNIEIKQDMGNVIVKEATNDKIQVIAYGEKEEDIKVDFNHDKLAIDGTTQKRITFFSFGNVKNDMIVYIPSSYSNEIKITNDLGNCEISNLENVALLDIDCDAGNVEANKIKNAKIKCDMGEVKIQEIKNQCDIAVDAGNVDISKLSIQEDSNIKADLGNVEISEINDIYIEAQVDLGKTNINGSNRDSNVTLKIQCDCGDIKVGK